MYIDSFEFAFDLTRTVLLIVLPIALLQFGLMIAAIVSLVRKPPVPDSDKILWLLLIILLGLIGPILYFVIGSNQLDEKAARLADEKECEGREQ
ncbi:MAG: PLDc N-terminal domain-containing protein [Defluviitaleaceae bacterium]|nr:PLDc N-terminal domain-containing protein [Defluviitaleaceae bacterium]